jgi:hypothetical protein
VPPGNGKTHPAVAAATVVTAHDVVVDEMGATIFLRVDSA